MSALCIFVRPVAMTRRGLASRFERNRRRVDNVEQFGTVSGRPPRVSSTIVAVTGLWQPRRFQYPSVYGAPIDSHRKRPRISVGVTVLDKIRFFTRRETSYFRY